MPGDLGIALGRRKPADANIADSSKIAVVQSNNAEGWPWRVWRGLQRWCHGARFVQLHADEASMGSQCQTYTAIGAHEACHVQACCLLVTFSTPSRASITSREGTLLPGPAGSGAPDLSNERQQRGIRCRGTALPWARSIFRLLNRTCAGASISRAVRTSALSAFVAVAALPLFWLVRNSPYVSAAILQTMLERSASQCVPSSLDRHFLMPSLASVTRASRWCPLP